MHQARLETESMLAAFCRSHDKLFLTVSVRCSSWRASSAIAVASTCGRSGTPYTRLFPEFHPPSTHSRSRSISTPKWMRFSDSSERLQTVNCSMAMMLKAVGMTQLAEPVTQGQPYLSGSKRTLRSEVLNFHRQNSVPLGLVRHTAIERLCREQQRNRPLRSACIARALSSSSRPNPRETPASRHR